MSGTWHGLTNQPTFNTSTMLLLTDGRIMVQEEATPHWHALKPDSTGSYTNGTWQTLADMSTWRRYYASAIMKDGRVIICGGEQTGIGGDTNRCEIYDPVADTWTTIASPPGWSEIGDAACCMLPDGRLMIGNINNTTCAIYDPVANAWSAAASKAVLSDEETWVLLPDNTILAVETWSPYSTEKYIISSNTWKNEGNLPVTLVNPNMQEIGPAVLLYNGKVIYFGAESSGGFGKTAIYTLPSTPGGTGTWVAGPNIPQIGGTTMVCNDCPCTLMPNGKVLFTAANYISNNWGSPIYFFEYDPVTNSIAQAPTPSNNNAQEYWSRLMLLPNGQVLFSPSSNNMQVYFPDGSPQDAWRPTISSVNKHNTSFLHTDYFTVSGTQLNGLSQANMYGDDCYPCTNYPLVRLKNRGTGEVRFQRTYNLSTMGVATGSTVQSFRFSAAGLPYGDYDLAVIANGISSYVFELHYQGLIIPKYFDTKNPILEVKYKNEIEILGKEIAEGDPWDQQQWVEEGEISELKSEIKFLQNSVARLSSMIKTQELPAVGKESARKEKETKNQETSVKGKKLKVNDPDTVKQL